MKRILVTGAGGTPSTNFIRSLKDAPEKFYFIGVDCNKYYLQRAEVNERYLVPYTDDPNYLSVLKDIIQETRPDFLYSQPDQEIAIISEYRDELGVKIFLPRHETVMICQNKFSSYEFWRKADLTVPETKLVHNEKDLVHAFELFGSPLWLRALTSSGGGRGSFKATNLEQATNWLSFWDGWGNFTAASCLEEHSVTWMSIWKDGELLVAQGRKRLYWEFSNRAPSGVTGITGTGVTLSDQVIDETALKTIIAIDERPNGIFSVDMTYDKHGVPNPTEINIGRFFTTHYFFTKAGLNMPYIFIKAAFNEQLPEIKTKINPLKPGLAWIRGMDFLPILTDEAVCDEFEVALKRRVRTIKTSQNNNDLKQ